MNAIRLPIKTIIFLVLGVSACAQNNGRNDSNPISPAAAASTLEGEFKAASSVNFYLMNRTGEYSFDPSDFKKASTIRLYRACGANCHRLMSRIIDQLREAVPSKCLQGQQDVLIEANQAEVVYSFSGRLIKYKGECYLSSGSVQDVLRSSSYFF